MTRRLGAVAGRCALLGVLASLLACATPGVTARPTDFPFHGGEPGPVAVHWRLEREAGAVVAVGLVEVAAADRIAEVALELQELDREGRVVSRAFDRARPRGFSGDVLWPFAVRLRPRGPEERFAVRVADVTWKLMRGGL